MIPMYLIFQHFVVVVQPSTLTFPTLVCHIRIADGWWKEKLRQNFCKFIVAEILQPELPPPGAAKKCYNIHNFRIKILWHDISFVYCSFTTASFLETKKIFKYLSALFLLLLHIVSRNVSRIASRSLTALIIPGKIL